MTAPSGAVGKRLEDERKAIVHAHHPLWVSLTPGSASSVDIVVLKRHDTVIS